MTNSDARPQPLGQPSPPSLALSAQDEALHPLLRHALAQRDTTGPGRVWAGLKIVPGAIKLIRDTEGMWKLVVWPALINIALFVMGMGYVWTHKRGWMEWVWAFPPEAWLQALWWIVYILLSIALSGLVYTTTVLVGGIVASPFNDMISQRTEQVLLGDRYVPPPPGNFVQEVLRSVWSSTVLVLAYAACMLPVLALNLVPAVGQAAYTAIALGVSSYFLALEYSDVLLQRRRIGLREKFGLVWRERGLTMGFGLGTSLTLALPLLNFLCIPIAVVGGTVVGLSLEQWRFLPDRQPIIDAG